MSQQSLDYRSPTADAPRSAGVRNATFIVCWIVLAANFLLLAVAVADRGFGAVGVAIMFGPIANGILLLASLACIPIVKSRAAGASLGPYVTASIALPLAAVPIDFFIIFSMGMGGC